MEELETMEWTGLNELREKYLSFFESKGHLRLNSFRFSLLFLTTKHPPIIPERHTPNPPPQAHTSN